ncbi:MAG: collagen-like protein [Methylococcaceae bacterium]|nr:collagen-like protein [Methylococcaceae bacterium]
MVVTAPKAKLPNADYLVWVSKDDKFSRENSDYFDLTVGAGGPQGPTGINGKDGAPGKDGAAGQQGLQGVPGAQGIIGSQGSKGDQGSPGAKGDTGAQGAIGPQGPKGDQGSPGAAGISGYEVKSVSATIGSVFNNGQALTAVCPSNKKVLGGGCDTQTPLTQAINSLPTPDNRGWGCRFNTGGINERITAYAVCANVQ